MSKKLLITFGCSWTYGVGVGYTHGMNIEQYKAIAWDDNVANRDSFRGILSKKYGYKNKNFSYGGSSNQKQFRLAKEYFGSLEFLNDIKYYDRIIVLWGITSIYRNELFNTLSGTYENFFYHTDISKFHRAYFKNVFDEKNTLNELVTEILLWNNFFRANNIENYWFDTFNHHDYNFLPTYEEIHNSKNFSFAKIKKIYSKYTRILDYEKTPRDIASQLAEFHGIKTSSTAYHISNWSSDSVPHIKFLKEKGVLNPISFHPTRLGHKQISNYFLSKINF